MLNIFTIAKREGTDRVCAWIGRAMKARKWQMYSLAVSEYCVSTGIKRNSE